MADEKKLGSKPVNTDLDNKHSLEAQQPKRIDFINLNKKNS